ncbi:MAG: SIS domain-containing protein [Candidatus Yanofskybacteria bacterium]|nr:SIS domain-containing protein [Candidatus Yanofskybacteria bacterium]
MVQVRQQLIDGLNVAKRITPINPSDYSRIIFCGMGGSIMPAEAISMLWLEDIAVYINRARHLPHWASKEHLVICTSWSGNTEETIASYESAMEKNIKTVVITSGGRLAELARKDGVILILLPNQNLNPRNAFGSMLASTLTLFSHSDIIESTFNSPLFSQEKDNFGFGASISEAIGAKTPIIYSSYSWRFLGLFWKKFFNENSKIHAFASFLPEAVHNEIAGVKEKDQRFFYLILEDSEEETTDRLNLEKFYKFLKKYNTENVLIKIEGKTRLEKVLGQYILASTTSAQLAQQLGVDPDSTEIIESFKKL